jgi:hypothetical protein
MNNTGYLLFLGIVILFYSCKKKKAESTLDILKCTYQETAG